MPVQYQIDNGLIQTGTIGKASASAPVIEVVSDNEFTDIDNIVPENIRRDMSELLEAESCYVDVFPSYIIGSIAIPDKTDLEGDRNLFSFYWTLNKLIFIDESNIARTTLNQVKNIRLMQNMNTATCMREFLRALLVEDSAWLGDLEDEMESAEENMLDGNTDTSMQDINAYRRATVRFTTYYQQMSGMLFAISANENHMMSDEEANSFKQLIAYADRLEDRAGTIREYSLQLRELHQTQVSMEQNKTMQLLTIVTVLIAPLSLLSGFFGMNFTMGITNEPWGLPLVCGIGIAITIVLLAWFHKKKWL